MTKQRRADAVARRLPAGALFTPIRAHPEPMRQQAIRAGYACGPVKPADIPTWAQGAEDRAAPAQRISASAHPPVGRKG